MSNENNGIPSLTIPKIDTELTQPSPSSPYLVNSPTNSGIKSGSTVLKKTKYDKLLKLYKDLKEKKRKITSKQSEIQQLKVAVNSQKKVEAAGQQNLDSLLEQIKIETIREEEKGQARSKQLLKQIYDLDAEANKNKQKAKTKSSQQIQKYTKQIDELKTQIQQVVIQKTDLAGKLSILYDEQKKINQQLDGLKVQDPAPVELKNQKNKLSGEIKSNKQEIIKLENEIKRIKQSSQTTSGLTSQLQKKLSGLKKQVDQLKKKNQDEDKKLKQTANKIKKQKDLKQKIAKSIPTLQKQIVQIQESLKKLEKQEQDKRQKLKQGGQQKKQKNGSEQLKKSQLKTQKLKAQLESLKRKYQEQQTKSQNLVPPKTIQKLKQEGEQAKKLFESNKLLPEQIQKTEKQIHKLNHQIDSLKWNRDPTLNDLDNDRKKYQQDQVKLQQQVKTLSKQEEKVTKVLEQYVQNYPQFETIRIKNKKSLNSKKQVKEEPKKVEQSSTLKKKKKSKNEQKSPEPEAVREPEPVVEKQKPKVQKKEDPVSPLPVKTEKKEVTEPASGTLQKSASKQEVEKKKKKKK